MTVSIPQDLQPFVRNFIASGRCASEQDVVGLALRCLRDCDKQRDALRQAIQEGMDSGQSIPASVVFERLDARVIEATTSRS